MRTMRMRSALKVAALGVLLTGCIAPALLIPGPRQLMWALLKPLVGFDPNAVNLFEQPIVKQRMTSLLGPHYDTAMQLLETADKLEQEGPLFFIVSRYTPIPQIAEKAGLVWNADTNQMAVAVLKGDGVKVFSEAIERAAAAKIESIETAAQVTVDNAVENAVQGAVEGAVSQIVPVWPQAMQSWVQP